MKKLICLFLLVAGGTAVHGQNSQIDSLMGALKTSGEDTSRVITLNSLSWEFLGMSRFDTAFYYAEEAMSLSKKLRYQKGQIRAFNNFGGINWNHGEYDKALENYFRGREIATAIDDRNAMAIANNNIGLVYWNQGKYSEALHAFFESLKISRQKDDKKAMILAYNNIGIIYYQQGNYKEALRNYYISISLSRSSGDKKALLLATNNVGLIYLEQAKYDQALATYQSALRISREMDDKKTMAMAYCNIALVQYRQGLYDESNSNHLQSLKIMDEIGTVYGKAINYNSIGRILVNRGKYREAKKWLEKAFVISQETGDNDGIRNSCQSLAILDSAMGDWKGAYENYMLYIAARDSLTNQEQSRKALQAQMDYDYGIREAAAKAAHEKKEVLANAEIGRQKVIRNAIAGGTGLLVCSSLVSFLFYKRKRDVAFQKKEAEAKQQEAELKQQVSEVEMKALRSQMNPHFIFNSLNSIYRYMENHDIEKAGSYLIRFSKLIRLILENSMHPEVTLQEDIDALELYMEMESMRLNNKFDFSFEIDKGLDAGGILVPPLLLQPFVENAIWHGLLPKPEQGHITIRVNREGDKMIRCEVEDNGVGREKSQSAQKMNGKKKSLGMAITRERIELINRKKGTQAYFNMVDLKSSNNEALGSRVEVLLPLIAD